MARRKKLLKTFFGILIGIIFFQLFISSKPSVDMCFVRKPLTNRFGSEVNEDVVPNKNLVFVGVMTAAQYVDTRAKAVYDTWGRSVPGKILFYSSEFSNSNHVPLVALKGVDDSYPPQRKSFMMLKHMFDHYIDQYEWFIRADDDVYVRTDRLEELLRSVDSRKPWFIGQTGRGNTEEFGLLSLESDENFCMGGPGVIFSRETLKRIAPYVEECLANLYTTHEDVELGRCVRRFAGIACTWAYEASDCACKMQVILYHNQSGQAAFSGDLKQKEVHRAITLHPVKKPQYMYRLHNYIQGLKIQNYQHEAINLHRNLASSMVELGYSRNRLENVSLVEGLRLFPESRGTPNYLGDTSVLGIAQGLNRYKPENLDDVIDWELISKTLYSYKDLNPRKRIGSSLKEGLNDVVRDIMEIINSYSKQRGRVIDFKEILYGYWRLDPIHGADLILDLLLVYRKYRGHKMTVQVRRHAYVQQTFTDIAIREVISSDSITDTQVPVHKQLVNKILSTFEDNLPIFKLNKDTVINFILPLSGRFEIFRRFIKIYEQVVLKQNEAARLFIILYKNTDYENSEKLIKKLQKKYATIELIILDDDFARAKALAHGASLLNDNDLMLFIDVDIVFDKSFLERLRKNTKLNKTVYFPIVYSLYNPKLLGRTYAGDFNLTQDLIDENAGFWRQFGFGIVGIYKIDYKQLGGFNLLISGWGAEDVNFYDNVVKSDLNIVRCVDPSLIHVYHAVNCDSGLDSVQRNMCLGTQASTLGSLKQLQILFKKYEYLFR